jgi:hypothetical protein
VYYGAVSEIKKEILAKSSRGTASRRVSRSICYDLTIMDETIMDETIMDELLATRYRLLFQNYGLGDTGAVAQFKRHLIEWNVKSGGRLRWDAALFLLTNLDHLILRPYFGEIWTEGNNLLPLPKGLSADEWRDRARRATGLILEHLANGEGEISSHDVLQAIDINWNTLASLLGWG